MMKEKNSIARRDFLKTGLLTSLSVPTMLEYSSFAYAAPLPTIDAKHKILVIIKLDGGNDGLNTVIPWGNSKYYKSRKKIAIKESEVLKIDGVKAAEGLGFHPEMGFFTEQFQEGNLAVINCVGYPNPNRSHFKSGAIWECGLEEMDLLSEYEIRLSSGWLGRYFDKYCVGEGNLVGAYYGESPLAMQGASFTGTSISDLLKSPFGFMKLGEKMAMHPAFRKMQEISKKSEKPTGDKLSFVRNVASETQKSTDKIRKLFVDANHGSVDFPKTTLGKQLGMISELIINNGNTRVYQASITGFDTHKDQLKRHTGLWKNINDSLKAFMGRMKAVGLENDVAVMTYSEFGRQLKENGTGGTDHGAAAPMFVLGGAVKGAIHGKAPSLKKDKVNSYGGLTYEIDFRQVYRSILEQYLKVKTTDIISVKHKMLDLFDLKA